MARWRSARSWVMPTLKVILLGGMQEPGHGGGSTLVGLLTDQGQWEALVRGPGWPLPAAVDEGLRWISPIGAQERYCPHGATVAGTEISAGANVAAILASANRDRAVWGEDADAYDLFRQPRRSAAFGFGKHFCIGHHFSKVQAMGRAPPAGRALPAPAAGRDPATAHHRLGVPRAAQPERAAGTVEPTLRPAARVTSVG